MTPRLLAPGPLCAAATLLIAGTSSGQAAPRPQLYALENVSLDRGAPDGGGTTLILRDGRIEAIQPASADVPPGARRIDGAGLLCLPGFVDAYTTTGVETPQPEKDQDVPVDVGSDVRIDMRQANRKGIAPAFRAADALGLPAETVEAWQVAGFGAALIAPSGELLSGAGTVAATREAAVRDLVIQPVGFMHATFSASGPSYPSTLMGYHAQLRQFFLDAEHQRELVRRFEEGRPGLRPPFDAELAAGIELLDGKPIVCHADGSRDIERWLRLGDEFGLSIAISGGGEAWRVAERLAERGVPVFLTLDWDEEVDDPSPDEPEKKEEPEALAEEESPDEAKAEDESPDEAKAEEEAQDEPAQDEAQDEEVATTGTTEATQEDEKAVWTYEEPLGVREERRRLWEEQRDNAIRLHEAGVRFAFGTGAKKPKDLLDKVRTLVEVGLPAEVAEAALTREAADLLQLEGLGRIEPGGVATLTLWKQDPLTDKKAKVAWSIVDGFPREFEVDVEEGGPPAEGIDVTGSWVLETTVQGQPSKSELELEMDDSGAVTGTIRTENPQDGSTMQADVTGNVSGKEVRFSATYKMDGFEIEIESKGEVSGDTIEGSSTMRIPFSEDPIRSSFKASRGPKGGRQ